MPVTAQSATFDVCDYIESQSNYTTAITLARVKPHLSSFSCTYDRDQVTAARSSVYNDDDATFSETLTVQFTIKESGTHVLVCWVSSYATGGESVLVVQKQITAACK